MSKEVVIAGVAVIICLGAVTVAFLMPRHPKVSHADTSLDVGAIDPSSGTVGGGTDAIASQGNPGVESVTPPISPITPITPISPAGNPTAYGPSGLPSPIGPGQTHIDAFPHNGPPAPVIKTSVPMIDENPTAPPSEEKTHVVASGETLGQISMQYYGTSKNWKKIAEANKVDPSELMVGQKLTIPVIPGSTPKDKDAPVTLAEGESSYKVKAGDSYYNIAKHQLGNANRWKELEKLNHISAEDLHVGQTIKLPPKTTSSKDSAETPPIDNGAGADLSTSSGKSYVVAKGDTLSGISKKFFGTTGKWKEIVKANPGVDVENLKVGQKLVMPEIAGITPPANQGNPTTAPIDESSDTDVAEYVIKKGDTPAKIAQHVLGSKKAWKRILDLNPGLNDKNLPIGRKLKVPGKAKSPDAGTTKPLDLSAPLTPFPHQPTGPGGLNSNSPGPALPAPNPNGFPPAGTPTYPLPPASPTATPSGFPTTPSPTGGIPGTGVNTPQDATPTTRSAN